MTTAVYDVRGMTCSHCARSVREELLEVPGVRRVDVDVDAGRVAVEGEDVPAAAVHAAVRTAGYEVAP